MRDFSRTCLSRVHAGWFWPLALLALPACGQLIGVQDWSEPVTNNGPAPRPSVIFCEIQQPPGRRCATQAEVDNKIGLPLSAAATALVSGQSSPIGFDYSAASTAKCSGLPEAVLFQGSFPDGYAACLNCAQVADSYSNDPKQFCSATCQDLFNPGGTGSPVPPDIVAFCNANTRVATNFIGQGACLNNACLDAGTLKADFADPRRTPEPVNWQDLIGVSASNGTLTRTAATSNPKAFDAGADSAQVITHGDAYVEFTASGPDTARLCGFSEGAPPDTNPDYTNIGFALDLFDSHVYVFEKGNKAAGPDTDPASLQSFGPYADGEKFRVNIFDNLDGTAKVTYTRLTGSCTDGKVCPEEVLYPSVQTAHYPLRVDSSIRELDGTLKDVRVVRIR